MQLFLVYLLLHLVVLVDQCSGHLGCISGNCISLHQHILKEYELPEHTLNLLNDIEEFVFGAGYFDQDNLMPIVDINTTEQLQQTTLDIRISNPTRFSYKMKHFIYQPPPDSPTARTTGSSVCVSEATLLRPLEEADLATIRTGLLSSPGQSDFAGYLVLMTKVELGANTECRCAAAAAATSCGHQATTASHSPTAKQPTSTWTTTLIPLYPIRYTQDGDFLMPRTHVLHFGTVSSTIGSNNRTLELINLSSDPISVTQVTVGMFDTSVVVYTGNRTVPADAAEWKTVAIITLSALSVPQVYMVTGFISVRAGDNRIAMRVPYVAKLVHGSVKISWTNGTSPDHPADGIHYRLHVLNGANVPVLMLQPQLSPELERMVEIRHQLGCTILPLSPVENTGLLVLDLIVRHSLDNSLAAGTITLVTNLTRHVLSVQLWSGRVQIHIPSARLVSGVFDMGHYILQGTPKISELIIHNQNPFNIPIEWLIVTTIPGEDSALDVAAKGTFKTCHSSCFLAQAFQFCPFCITQIRANTSKVFQFKWGGAAMVGTVEGFILLHTSLQNVVYYFRFYADVGELTMLPDPIQIDGLFPGRRVQRNVIVESSYPNPIHLTHLGLARPIGRYAYSLDPPLGPNYGSFELHVSNTDSAASAKEFNRTRWVSRLLTPKQPTLVASLVINPSDKCNDPLNSRGLQTDTRSWKPQQKQDSSHEAVQSSNLCYTGFSLDTEPGRALRRLMYTNQSVDWHADFHHGLLINANLYAHLRSLWTDSKRPRAPTPRNSSPRMEPSAYIGFGVSSDNAVANFWSDLTVSYVWPRIVSSTRRVASHQTTTSCRLDLFVSKDSANTMDSSVGAGDSSTDWTGGGQALRAHFPTSAWSEPVNCDLVVTNPSDKPLLIQPFLLGAVYGGGGGGGESKPQSASKSDADGEKKEADDGEEEEPLASFLHTLGFPFEQRPVSKLAKLIVGSFSLRVVRSQSVLSTLPEPEPGLVTPPCFPILLLPPTTGVATFRLTFNPDQRQSMGPAPSDNSNRSTMIAHDLLFIRNNLTALEPVWLNARQGRAALAMGVRERPQAASGPAASTTNRSFGAGAMRRLLEARWIQGSVTTKPPFDHGTEDKKTTESQSAQKSNGTIELVPSNTPVIQFDFTVDSLWPFCSGAGSASIVYSIHEEAYSENVPSLSEKLQLAPPSGLSYTRKTEEREEEKSAILSGFPVRDMFVLANSGDVPIVIRSLALGPDKDLPIRAYGSQLPTSCMHTGFRLTTSCLPSSNAIDANSDETNKNKTGQNLSEEVELKPGHFLPLEVRYHPDLLRSRVAARLWLTAYPKPDKTGGGCTDKECSHQMNGANEWTLKPVAVLRLQASVPVAAIRSCLTALPRPWLEHLMWPPIVALFAISFAAVLFVGVMDGSRLFSLHICIRENLDRFAMNIRPQDTVKSFSFRQLVHDEEQQSMAQGTVNSTASRRVGTAARSVIGDPANPTGSSAASAETQLEGFTIAEVYYACVGYFHSLVAWFRIPVYYLRLAVLLTIVVFARGFKSKVEEPVLEVKPNATEAEDSPKSNGRTVIRNKPEVIPVATTRSNATRTIVTDPALRVTRRKRPIRPTEITSDPDSTTTTDSLEPRQSLEETVATAPVPTLRRGTTAPTTATTCTTTATTTNPVTEIVKPVVMTEARIAAAVRATMRLAEDANGQARRRVVRTKPTAAAATTTAVVTSSTQEQSRNRTNSETVRSISPSLSSSSSSSASNSSPVTNPQDLKSVHETVDQTIKKVLPSPQFVTKRMGPQSRSRLAGTNALIFEGGNINGFVVESTPVQTNPPTLPENTFHEKQHLTTNRRAADDQFGSTRSLIPSFTLPESILLKHTYASGFGQTELGVCWPSSTLDGAHSQGDSSVTWAAAAASETDQLITGETQWDDGVAESSILWEQDAVQQHTSSSIAEPLRESIVDWSYSSSTDDVMGMIAANSRAFADVLLEDLSAESINAFDGEAPLLNGVQNESIPLVSMVGSDGESVKRKPPGYNGEPRPEWTDDTVQTVWSKLNLPLDSSQPDQPPTKPVKANLEIPEVLMGEYGPALATTATAAATEHDEHDAVWSNGVIPSTSFYELPQITHARRLSMLKHEGRCRAQLAANAWLGLADQSNADLSSPPPPPSKPTTTIDRCGASSLTNGSIESSASTISPLSLQLPSWLVEKEVCPYQPWTPIDTMDNSQLLHALGLEETDHLLSIGPSFSYMEQYDQEWPGASTVLPMGPPRPTANAYF